MLEFLSSDAVRKKCGIKEKNKFLFANTGDTVIKAGDALNEVKERAEVKLHFPDRLKATNLRKYTATIAQVLSLSDQETKWLCNHLGHTQKVHDQYYRQISGLIERIEIAKLMLIQENNLVGKYSNKNLADIQFEDIELDISPQEDALSDAMNSNDGMTNNDDKMFKDISNILEDEGNEGSCFQGKNRSRPTERVKWTNEELKEVREFFSSYFDGSSGKKCPGMEECKESIRKSKENNGVLQRRKWETIKKKVSYLMHLKT